ncbi:MFS transporter [Rhodoferax sp. BLA1]|uniref:MFS transporter n=1 Tax=Rhodoferax sp. BLA1 TaxID=2576062 RepID=UPI0015D32A35|nr:MFS transporter [Rhodoferax sp. BLA1]
MLGATASASAPLAQATPSLWKWRFGLIYGGQALSLMGSALTQFVLLWWITDTTGDMSSLAFAGMVALLPQALLSPLGGTLADRYSRRVLMIAADAVSALCMLVLMLLFVTEQVALWHVYVMMGIRSAMQAFQMPAAEASVAMLVPTSFLPRAAGLNQTLQNLTMVAAAPLGALAISVLPFGWALGIDVVTALLGIVPLLVLRIPQSFARQTGKHAMWGEFVEGVHLVWRIPGLRRLYGLLAAVVLVVMPTFTLVPLLVKTHFGGGAPEVALMEGLEGIGMILGGLLVTALAPQRKVPWVLAGLAASCLAMALTSLMPSGWFQAAVVCWIISGVTFALGNAPLVALLQTSIPNHLQGRALSLLNAVMGLAAPVGLLFGMPLGEWIGVRWMFVLLGLVGAVVALLGFTAKSIQALDDGL